MVSQARSSATHHDIGISSVFEDVAPYIPTRIRSMEDIFEGSPIHISVDRRARAMIRLSWSVRNGSSDPGYGRIPGVYMIVWFDLDFENLST